MNMNGRSIRLPFRIHLVVLAALFILALFMWWPLPLVITTRVPGTPTWAFDESTFLWNIWYFQHALLRLETSPLHADIIWHPVGIDLILYTYNVLNALLAAPLYWATGNVAFASNIILIVQTVLSGYGVFLLVLYLLRSTSGEGGQERVLPGDVTRGDARLGRYVAAAFVAALVYAFASNRAVYAAMGHYDMVSTGFIPFYVLYLLRALDRAGTRQGFRDAALAGLMFTLAVLAEMIFAVFLAIFTFIAFLTYGVKTLDARGETTASLEEGDTRVPWRMWMWRAVSLAVIGTVAAVLWSPVLIPVVRELLTGDYVLKGWGDSIKLSVDLFGFITPTALHPLWGMDWARALRMVEEGTSRFSDINTVFVGYVTLALALLGLFVARRAARVWGWAGLIFALLCLGPFLQINGRWQFDLDGIPVTIPMPFALLHYIPFVRGNRAPNRNSVLLMLALAMLVAYGLSWLWPRLARMHRRLPPMATVVVALLILFEHAAFPLPTSDARIPAVYDLVAAEPGEFTLLQVPLGWRNSFGVFGVERTQIQYYQVRHGKPMLGGNISRAPEFKMAYFRRIPLFQAIADVEFGKEPDPALVEKARAQAPELMRLYNVRYVLLFPPIPGRYPYAQTWERTWAFVRDVLPLEESPFWAEDGIEAYRVIQPSAPVAMSVDLGEPGTAPYRGEGWYENEVIQGRSAVWAGANGTEARVFLRADGDAPHILTLSVLPFAYPNAPPQTLQVWINGRPVGPMMSLNNGWQDLAVEVPAGVTRNHTNVITLRFGWTKRPRDVFEGRRHIGSTGVEVPVDVEITAFADGAYMSTVDDDGTRHDVSYGRRGYNLTLLDPQTGRVIDKTGFDTYANAYEAQSMARYIESIPAGTIVLVATKGDAARHLTDDAVAALRKLGGQVDLRQHPGQFHALVGVKGAAPATAEEVVAAPSAYIYLGDYPDFRTLGIAVDKIALTPLEE